MAGTESMKYSYCDYSEQVCMNSEAALVPQYNGRLRAGSVPGQFYTNSSCFYRIGSPSEVLDNSVVKVKINKLANATCFLNYGGEITTVKSKMTEIPCQEGETYQFNYTDMTSHSPIYLVSYATYIKPKVVAAAASTDTTASSNSTTSDTTDSNSTTSTDTTTTTDSTTTDNATTSEEVIEATVQVIGSIEFEYWAENEVAFSDFFDYVIYGLGGFGVCICMCLLLIYKSSIEEQIDDMRIKMRKVKGKPKDYVKENAPQVLEMVQLAQEEAGTDLKQDGVGTKQSKKKRINDLEAELSETWCIQSGLSPVTSRFLGVFIVFFNIVLPGFGTMFSACCGRPRINQKVQPTDEAQPPAPSPETNDEENAEDKKLVNLQTATPPVLSLFKAKEYAKKSALLTGLLQLLTAPTGMGWIWSISHGLIIFENAQIYHRIAQIEKEPDDQSEKSAPNGSKKPKDQDENENGFG
mmetsp:Transcript_11056/g.18489  ORF Transcript_11056/g.18489 Transcript_11056/m.18489 type:complete len:467 (-) Transcript_11056:34-1434(-)